MPASWPLPSLAGVALALALAALAVRAMRRLRLHWSWAVLAGLPALFSGAVPASARTIVLLAAGACALGARRRHRRDLEAGADLAELASMELRPLDVLLPPLRRLVERTPWRIVATDPAARAALAIGRDERGRTVAVPLGERQGRHMLVVGATGSGKTVTQSLIAVNAIARGLGAIVVDPKGDGSLREQIASAAGLAARPFICWSPRGEAVYNPLARGSETEIADRALAGERFTEPHYLRQAQRYLGHAVRAMRAAGVQTSLPTLVEHLDVSRLEVLARTLPAELADSTHSYLDALTARQQAELAGVRDRLAILAESDVGRWLDPRTRGTPLELGRVVRERGVAYFALEADSRPLLAGMLGAAIVQDLLGIVSVLQAEPTPTLVVIDEFSALAAEQVVRLFARARSAGLSLLLGTQELSDLRLRGREQLLEQVLGNLSALVAHRQAVPSSAALLAQIAGTRGTWLRMGGGPSPGVRTRSREAVIGAERIMSLPTGWAAVIVPGGAREARLARVFMPAAGSVGERDDGSR